MRLLALLLAVASPAIASDGVEQVTTQESAAYLRNRSDFDLTALEKILAGKKRIEDVLKALPDDLLSNYALLRDSSSLQKSRPGKPRVILYGGRGLLVAFNDGTLPGGKAIELLQIGPGNRWTAAEYVPGKGLERNPARCTQCHGEPLRPLWDSYNCWTGAYGMQDDTPTPREKTELEAFRKSAASHPRYGVLKDFASRFQKYEQGKRLASGPNSGLQDFIVSYDDVRTAQLIRATPDFDRFKFAVVGTLLGCHYRSGAEDSAAFFPSSLQAWFASAKGGVRATFDDYHRRKNGRLGDFCASMDYGENEIAFRALFSARAIPTSNFFSQIHFRDPTFLAHAYARHGRNPNLVRLLAGQDPDLAWLPPDSADWDDCKRLQEKSREVLKTYSPPGFPPPSLSRVESVDTPASVRRHEDTAVSLTFAKCITCHAEGNSKDARFIPFNSASGLRAYLTADPSRRGRILELTAGHVPPWEMRMPPIGALEEFERDAIREYLSGR